MVDMALVAISTLSAIVAGFCLGTLGAQSGSMHFRTRQARAALGGKKEAQVPLSFEARIAGYIVKVSRCLAAPTAYSFVGRFQSKWVDVWVETHARKAGRAKSITTKGFVESTFRLGVLGALGGSCVGVIFSTELAALGCLAGAVAGLSLPAYAIKREEQTRAEKLEQNLSEMLEVMCLGLRSGLSFDRSFELYASHFDVTLARECVSAQRAWSAGLTTREQALRDLALSYDSLLLSRVVETMVRSLRFGSSLVESLEAAAYESRSNRRANIEERVAKAPVKMMIPTGTLILPAMLILVLGPVLLELMEGF